MNNVWVGGCMSFFTLHVKVNVKKSPEGKKIDNENGENPYL